MPLAGRLADRLGSARLCRLAGLAVAVLPLALWTAGTIAELICVLLAFGVTGGLMSVGLAAQGVRMEQAHRRPLMASFYASFSLGGLAGAVLGGLLAWLGGQAAPERPRHYRGGHGHRADRRAIAAPRAQWAGRRDDRPPERPARPAGLRTRRPPGIRCRARPGRGEGRRWRGPGSSRLIALGLLALCSLIAEGGAANWSGLYLRENLGAQRGHPGRRVRGLLARDGRGAAGRRPAGRPVRSCGDGPQVRPAGLGRAGRGLTQSRFARCGHRVRRQRRRVLLRDPAAVLGGRAGRLGLPGRRASPGWRALATWAWSAARR